MNDEMEPPVTGGRRRGDTSACTWLERQLDGCQISSCPIVLLLPADSPRLGGEVDDHVRLLGESADPLPPIIVHRPSMRVVDGMHRLRAAMERGDSHIQVRWYNGREQDIFALAVQANVAHGLPLSLADRRRAATRLIESHPHWSDRMIGSIVNLSATTVGTIRGNRSTVQLAASNARVGLDGRIRPISTAASRRRAGQLLRDNPDAPLRQIARSTGLAPSTVLDVRNRLLQGLDPVPQGRSVDSARIPRNAASPPTSRAAGRPPSLRATDYVRVLQVLKKDPSVRYKEAGRLLLLWLQAGPTEAAQRDQIVEQLPSHCLSTTAQLARGQAAAWQELAHQLELRATPTQQAGSG